MEVNNLNKTLEKENIKLNDEQIKKFEKYKELIEEWNKKIDITNIVGEEIYTKHFLDSLTIFKTSIIKDNYKILDLGTGGGFPGIPMKIYNDTLEIDLLDSLKKRLNFLDDVIYQLDLKNVKTMHFRAEDLGKDKKFREKYDVVTSRAVANMRTLSEYCLPFVKVGGYFIAMKGPQGKKELEEAKKAIKILGGSIKDIIEFNLEDNERTLIVIEKIKNTPNEYPRGQGKPRKNTL